MWRYLITIGIPALIVASIFGAIPGQQTGLAGISGFIVGFVGTLIGTNWRIKDGEI